MKDFSEQSFAENFAEMHKEEAKYVTAWKAWIQWDGRKWSECPKIPGLRIQSYARQMFESAKEREAVATRALEAAAGDEEAERIAKVVVNRAKGVTKAAASLLKNSSHNALASIAMHHMAADPALFEARPMLWNCANGTLDLETLALRPRSPRDMLMLESPAAFNKDAQCPAFEAFVSWAMGGDEECIRYLQRCIGYAMTGLIREHVLLIHQGAGGNGKGTFFNTIAHVFGEYAGVIPSGVLFDVGREAHPAGKAAFFQKRLAYSGEIRLGEVFDDAVVKELTGGDKITARKMGQNFWEFKPTHKIFVQSNPDPEIRGIDDAMRRRIHMLRWRQTAVEVDPLLATKLQAEASGILNWCLEGLRAWMRDGLQPPASVVLETSKYVQEADAFAQFLNEETVSDPAALVPVSEFRLYLNAWCKEQGKEILPPTMWSGLKRRGLERKQARHNAVSCKCIVGVRWKTAKDHEMAGERVN